MYYVPGIAIGSGDTAVKVQTRITALMEVTV